MDITTIQSNGAMAKTLELEKSIVFYYGSQDNLPECGMGFFIKQHLVKSIMSFEP